jgi:hypothetical protein
MNDNIIRMLKASKMKMRHYFSKIPIIGILSHISKTATKEASVDLSLTLIFATLPIWFGGAILTINDYFGKISSADRSMSNFLATYCQAIFKTISNGELLMYAAATLGPTLYLGVSSFGKKGKPFPWIRPQLVAAILINLFASVLFFVARDKGYAGEIAFVYTTIFFYILALILLFPAMAYDQQTRSDPSEALREGTQEFMTGYRDRRERGEA